MYISHVSNKTILYYLMNSEEYYCDFTIDKNYILAYKVYSKKIYKLYLYMIPKKNMFLKYIKSNRTKTKEELLQHLASHYECSLREAYEYYHMHHSDTIKNILKKRGVDDKEITHCVRNLMQTHAGTGFMHESFHKDDATKFTRKWFAWANTLFGELIYKLHQEKPALLKQI